MMKRTRRRLFGRLYDREELEAKGRIDVPGYSGKYRAEAYGKQITRTKSEQPRGPDGRFRSARKEQPRDDRGRFTSADKKNKRLRMKD